MLSVRSAADAVSSLLGRPPKAVVIEDELLGMVSEWEIVDLPPTELIERIRGHAILTPSQLARAMQQELRPSVLGMLRESALRMIADRVDRQFVEELRSVDGNQTAEVRGRVVLCLAPKPGFEDRIRRTAQYAHAHDATFAVVTVRPPGLSQEDRRLLGAYSTLTHQLRGEFVRLKGRLVAPALARYIDQSFATEIILGHRRHPRWRPWDTTSELIRLLEGVDIHIVRR